MRSHRVAWTPVVSGVAVMMCDNRPVGVAITVTSISRRGRVRVKFRYGGREYSFKGRDAVRQSREALLALIDTKEWMT